MTTLLDSVLATGATPVHPPAPTLALPPDLAGALCVETIAAQAAACFHAFPRGLALIQSGRPVTDLAGPDPAHRWRAWYGRDKAPAGQAITARMPATKGTRVYRVAIWTTPYSVKARGHRLAGSCSCPAWRSVTDRWCKHLVAVALTTLGYTASAATEAAVRLPAQPVPVDRMPCPGAATLAEQVASLPAATLRVLVEELAADDAGVAARVRDLSVGHRVDPGVYAARVGNAMDRHDFYDGTGPAYTTLEAVLGELQAVSATLATAALAEVLDVWEFHADMGLPVDTDDGRWEAALWAALGAGVDRGGWTAKECARFVLARVGTRQQCQVVTWLADRHPGVRECVRVIAANAASAARARWQDAASVPVPVARAAAQAHSDRVARLAAAAAEAEDALAAISC